MNKRAILTFIKLVRRREIRAFRFGTCPFCRPTVFVRHGDNEFTIRCLRCRSNMVTLSLASVLLREIPDLSRCHIYEISSRSALARCLQRHAGQVTLSQFFEDTSPGEFKNGIQCQDVQRLTYPDSSFDVCTSSEVFEHVPNDAKGFQEVYRVLKPGGLLLFTVPLSGARKTTERARLTENGVEHILPPQYHDDPILGPRTALAFRNYGLDILDKLREAGFIQCRFVQGDDVTGWGLVREVVSARKE